MRIGICLFLAILFIFPSNIGFAQATNKTITNDSKREEIQRYFGYEAPLSGYLTLPIDVSLNTNERGYFTDIGYVFLILVPILLLLKLRERRNSFWIVSIILFLLIMAIYSSTTYVLSDDLTKINHGNISEYTSNNNSILEDVYGQLLIGLNLIGAPINKIISNATAGEDFISYPVLLLLLGFILFVVSETGLRPKKKTLVLFTCLFGFYWLILSAGIIWYGYLMFPLLLIVMLTILNSKRMPLINKLVIGCLSLWLLVAIVARIAFISQTPNIDTQNIGKNIVNQAMFKRTLGLESSMKTIDNVHPGLYNALSFINADNKLILKIGTTLGYFVENGDSRIVNNNQLAIIDRFIQTYKTKEQITKALKLANIKYLMVDLNSASLDRTPERTLTAKYNRLLNYLINNNNLRLLATDRIVKSPTGDNTLKYDFIGDMYYSGSYAIFGIN